jgi:endonuclease YncB( thermonuclease family)
MKISAGSGLAFQTQFRPDRGDAANMSAAESVNCPRIGKLFACSLLWLALAGEPTSGAESPSTSSGGYKPRNAVQSTPMRAVVLDGITFRDIETNSDYRLYGIDACAGDQTAALGRQTWPCGAVATAWMVTATLGKWVACGVVEEIDNVKVARCATAEHADIAADMLKEGLALTLPQSDERKKIRVYTEAEAAARKGFKGLWASQFQFPWVYRAEKRARDDAETSARSPRSAPRDDEAAKPLVE